MATVQATLGEGTQVELKTRQFSWRSDEPLASGGTDSGPEPYEILVGALASCIALTLRVYANHKGIALAGVDLTLDYDRIHADDCRECDERLNGWIERIRTQVNIRGSFDDAQRKRLAQIVERCPVHKTLVNQVQIFDSVTFEGAS